MFGNSLAERTKIHWNPALGAAMTTTYRKRENFFEKSEREWRVEDEALVRRDIDGTESRWAWTDMRAVRLRWFPTYAKPWLHQFRIETAASKATIDNGHFQGIGQFEDRSASYGPFVRAALERIRALSPSAQVHIGSTTLAFWATMIFVALSFAGLAVVLILLPFPAYNPVVLIAKLAIIAYGLMLLPRWVSKNRPRRSDLAHAADDLPK